MSKRFMSLLLAVIWAISIMGTAAFAADVPEVFSFVDDLGTLENMESYSNITHKSDYGRIFKTDGNSTGTVIYDVSGKDVRTVSFEVHVAANLENYDLLLYVSEDNSQWGEAVKCTSRADGTDTLNYVIYKYTSEILPEGINFVKIEIPVSGQAWEIQVYEISYAYKNASFNIKDNDVLLEGSVELIARNVSDNVTALAFYSAGVKLCDAIDAGDGLWRGLWNATAGLYNVYVIATYSDENGLTGKKYSEDVKVTVIPSYTASEIDGKGTDDILKNLAKDEEGGYYYIDTADQTFYSLALDEGKYEISMNVRMTGDETVIRNFVLWDKSTAQLVRPFALQIEKPFSYQSDTDVDPYDAFSQTYINSDVICYESVWYNIKLIVDTAAMTEDIYVNGLKINSEPINISLSNNDLDGIGQMKITRKVSVSTASGRLALKEFKINKIETPATVTYNNLEVYSGSQKVSDMRYIQCDADKLTFECEAWDEANVVKCGDEELTAAHNADSKIVTVALPELTENTAYSITINDKKLLDFKTAKEDVEISSFAHTDIAAESLAAGNKVYGTAALLNDTGKFEDFNFFLALYNNKKLEKVVKLDEYVDEYDAYKNISTELTLPEGFSNDSYELKFFVFDNMTNLVPLR